MKNILEILVKISKNVVGLRNKHEVKRFKNQGVSNQLTFHLFRNKKLESLLDGLASWCKGGATTTGKNIFDHQQASTLT